MKRLLIFAATLFALSGCGQNPVAPPPAPPADPGQQEPEESMVMSGVDLYHHDPRPTGGVARTPTFWLHANTFSMLNENTWSVVGARAVIYEKDSDREQMVLEAERGRFEQDKSAYLQDNVTARAGTMLMKMSDIEWRNRGENTPSEVSTQNPLTVEDPEAQLQATSLKLYPDTREFELTDVVGEVHFRRNPS